MAAADLRDDAGAIDRQCMNYDAAKPDRLFFEQARSARRQPFLWRQAGRRYGCR